MRIPILTFLACLTASSPLLAKPSPDDLRRAAIRKGIDYLDARLFKLTETAGTPRKPWTYGIAGLVYLMEGSSTTPRGSKGRIERIRDYLEDYVDDVAHRASDPANLPPRHGFAHSGYLIQYTWPVATAGLFFAELELRGMGAKRSRKSLETALEVLAAAQQSNGGWGHGAISGKDGRGGYPNTLVSSSNCVAFTVGILDTMRGYETKEVVAKARDYFRAARLSNGSFPYDPSQRSSGFAKINVGRTAGSIFAMHCLGMPRDRAFKGSVKYLMNNFGWIAEGHGSPCMNVMHGALCCRMLGREAWLKFRGEYEPRIVAAQTEEGQLRCICEEKAFGTTCDSKDRLKGLTMPKELQTMGFGSLQDGEACYTTALHLFVLLLDGDRLKILKQRKPGPAITPR